MSEIDSFEIVALEANPASRFTLYQALTTVGVRKVRLATSVQHALALISILHPHIVLLDADDSGDWPGLVARVRSAVEPKDQPAKDNAYGITATDTFAGDLDELLGDGPTSSMPKGKPIAQLLTVVLMTARPTQDVVHRARSMGIAGILIKPLSANTLAARLKAAVRASERGTWSID